MVIFSHMCTYKRDPLIRTYVNAVNGQLKLATKDTPIDIFSKILKRVYILCKINYNRWWFMQFPFCPRVVLPLVHVLRVGRICASCCVGQAPHVGFSTCCPVSTKQQYANNMECDPSNVLLWKLVLHSSKKSTKKKSSFVLEFLDFKFHKNRNPFCELWKKTQTPFQKIIRYRISSFSVWLQTSMDSTCGTEQNGNEILEQNSRVFQWVHKMPTALNR